MLLKLVRSFVSLKPRISRQFISREMSSITEDILLETEGGVGTILLNRPKALNALNENMIAAMHPRLQRWQDEGVKLVIIKGAGDKAFCSGGDIRAITQERGGQAQKNFFRNEYLLDNLTGTISIPYVALLNGIVMGGGVGISVHGKYRVCCETTMFAMPETGIGLVPDVGGAYFLPRLPGSIGMFLGLTGHRLKGRDCLHAGIATHAVDSGDILNLEADLKSNPEDVSSILDKYSASSQFQKDKVFSLEVDMEVINIIFCLVFSLEVDMQVSFLPRSRYGSNKYFLFSFLPRSRYGKSDGSEFALKTLKALKRASPRSLKVAHRQITEGRNLNSLSQALNLEYRLVLRCCENDDFYEGVRALLIDRDNSPKWNPSSLQEVTDSMVDEYFKPLQSNLELNL
ncbi:3-hydroxyisobutyryl-CoA hydrolase, mitochondrial [Eurytemora carolleeae]|uniref:3-hydroxyisobutyryl-CoA hydrolase, mitochondrial n=1 Tax=Eurytemora carolleeae TaxID=1294199 RepID=UPI000C778509|nr:3-hydroxyisobutyryl-CoA hydrolase, mitochondrial [Eurytemora carolleeae]|eukprot:XP_023336814.1 3-hydroxyisobutyryl-CoA hydrolase, mitochondrial-like [Eurytemora affinis]